MSTIKTTYIQHPSSGSPNIELASDGTVVLPLSDLEDLNNVSGIPTDGQFLSFGTATSTWNPVDAPGGFDASQTITASNASWPVPSSSDGIFKVTVVGGGGGGGAAGGATRTSGGVGGTSSFVSSAGTITAAGGFSGTTNIPETGADANDGLCSGNGGEGGARSNPDGHAGGGGEIKVGYLDLSGVSTANVTIGAGGAGGSGDYNGGNGGDGVVIVEYKAA